MRLILILMIALALTIAWQTSVMADLTEEGAEICSAPQANGDDGQEPVDDEPDCD